MILLSFYISTVIGYSILIFFIIALVIIFFYYRITNPPINIFGKSILFFLRALAILFMILTFFEVVIGFSNVFDIKGKTYFLIDNSKSITAGIDSTEKLKYNDLLTSIQKIKESNDNFDVFSFSNKISDSSLANTNEIKNDGISTDISRVLNKIYDEKEKNYVDNIILITDGIYNVGEKPLNIAEKLKIPIYTIGVGNPLQKKDIVLDNIITNDIIYLNSETQVKVDIKNFGLLNKQVKVSLFENDKLLEQKEITLSGNYNEVFFNYKPHNLNESKLTATVEKLKEESNQKNNSLSKYINILNNKLNILLISSVPTSDFSFILNSLKFSDEYSTTGIIEKSNYEFYPQYNNLKKLDSADVIFLIGFPGKNTSDKFLNEVKNVVINKRIPIFILTSNYTDFDKLNTLQERLPYSIKRSFGDYSLVFIDVPTNSKNEITDFGVPNSSEIWNNLPPIYRIDKEFVLTPGAEALAYFKIQNNKINIPLIIRRNINKEKVIAFLGFEIWKLKLLNAIKEDENKYFDVFINNSVKWLCTKEINKQLRVYPLKKIFDNSEKVLLLAQFYDESNNPITNADIQVTIKKSINDSIFSKIEPLGKGLYKLELDNLTKGDYQYKASSLENNKLYTDAGRFTISETELEYKNLTMDENLLTQIASLTNGEYYRLNDFNNFLNNIDKKLKTESYQKSEESEEKLWNSGIFMSIIILLFAIEWFLRKRFGLL